MVNIFTRKCVLILFITIFACEIKTSEVPRPRGVSLSRAPLYATGKDFVCLDGSLSIAFSRVNDDYCDCPDGSDEPGTSACPNGMFYCMNAGHKPLNIPTSRVNDGICDCCDASDEYNNPKANCVNNCNELGRSARAEAHKKAELIKLGSQIRAELSQKGVLLKQEKKEKLLILNRNQNEAEQVRKEKEVLKAEIEELENVALRQYREVEEEQQKEKLHEEQTKSRKEAVDAFERFDSNQDGKLDISELQTRPTFDRNRDGQITDEEAKYFLDEHTELNFEDFYTVAWPKIKPFMMLESGLFKPPADNGDTTEDMQEEEYHEESADMDEEGDADAEDTDEHGDGESDVDIDKEEEQLVGTPAEEAEATVAAAAGAAQYDEETQRLIDRANEARAQFNQADKAYRDIQSDIKSIEESLQKDYGPDEEFAVLDGECFEYTDREYIYKLCPFQEVTQRAKAGGGDTRLGSWGHWVHIHNVRYEEQLYEHGQACWNGPQRSARVRLACGTENQLVTVQEPNRCEYLLHFSTPAACNPALLERTHIADDAHDEL